MMRYGSLSGTQRLNWSVRGEDDQLESGSWTSGYVVVMWEAVFFRNRVSMDRECVATKKILGVQVLHLKMSILMHFCTNVDCRLSCERTNTEVGWGGAKNWGGMFPSACLHRNCYVVWLGRWTTPLTSTLVTTCTPLDRVSSMRHCAATSPALHPPPPTRASPSCRPSTSCRPLTPARVKSFPASASRRACVLCPSRRRCVK